METTKVSSLPRCRVGDRCWIVGGDAENAMRVVRVLAKGAYPEAPGEFHWVVKTEGEPLIAYDADGTRHHTLGCNVSDDELRPLQADAANSESFITATGTALSAFICSALYVLSQSSSLIVAVA